jgi:hypothetical protein
MVWMTKNRKNFTAGKKFILFGSKTAMYLSLGFDVQATGEAFSPS